jgi:hypothetical protein
MEAKEKARELVESFEDDLMKCDTYFLEAAKKRCALITVEEILKCNLETSVSSNPHIEFNSKLLNQYQWWKEVKQEIEKL